jgi:hypothetical protein
MRYVCLVYFDPKTVFNQSPEAKAVLAQTMPYDQELAAGGYLVHAQALEPPAAAATLRVRDGQLSVTDGPFMETKEVLGGFLMIEASDLNEAIRIGAGIPLAKLGSIEVRPVSNPRPAL